MESNKKKQKFGLPRIQQRYLHIVYILQLGKILLKLKVGNQILKKIRGSPGYSNHALAEYVTPRNTRLAKSNQKPENQEREFPAVQEILG